MHKGIYYLSRIITLGNLDKKMLMDAITESPTITVKNFEWAITDVVDCRSNKLPYLFGKLSKFSREGHVTVVDTNSKSQVDATEENLLVASSPFVFLPNYSGLAYLHAWNGIQVGLFPRRFKEIIEATYKNFFVNCTIEHVSDYRAFGDKLKEIEIFTEISATVYPPNPLFGRMWGSLKDYVKKRNATEISIKESSKKGQGIDTDINVLIDEILEDKKIVPSLPPDITDAALLMAADGYGKGKVTGKHEGTEVIIRTAETQKSFPFSKDPVADDLANVSDKFFKGINKERDMRH